MAGGLAALLDDVAAMAKMAAASADDVAAASARTSAKAVGVVVDDAAVTPQYVRGLEPRRELPIVWRIARGSLVNKLLIILPVALLLSWLAPWALTPILMLGGTFLCFEGAEKIWELVHPHGQDDASGHGTGASEAPSSEQDGAAEDGIVKGAVRTDLILSAEIMVISLNTVADQPFLLRTAVLIVVGIALTALVYGAVGVLVKMDDMGLAMAGRGSPAAQRMGRGLVAAMPHVMTVISYVGMAAMLWVGGHILLEGTHELGAEVPYAWVHHLEDLLARLPAIGGAVGWLGATLCSMLLGLAVGALVLIVVQAAGRLRGTRGGRA